MSDWRHSAFLDILKMSCAFPGGFPGGSDNKNLPAMQETRIQSLSQEGPLEEGMATHSSVPAWRIPWTEEPGGCKSTGSQSWGWLSD